MKTHTTYDSNTASPTFRTEGSTPMSSLWRRIRSIVVAIVLAVTGVLAVPIAAHADAPDQWHCATAINTDQLCIHMNQVLGWWTGFDVQYRYEGFTSYPISVNLAWRTERYGSVRDVGAWPDTHFFFGPAANYQQGTWADLPEGVCAVGIAYVQPHYGYLNGSTYEVRVCR